MMLPDSQLYGFLDERSNIAAYFFEGQKLIHDLALIHPLKPSGFSLFRKAVLSFQPIIAFLKSQEGFGLYIDSVQPNFNLKIETNASGQVRTLLLPEGFDQFPERVTGTCRLTKVFTGKAMKQPYTSVISLENASMENIVNMILTNSYQIDATIKVTEASDQSIMLMKMPNIGGNIKPQDECTLNECWLKHQGPINELFNKGTTDEVEIKTALQSIGLTPLSSKLVQFKCACSRERMVLGLQGLAEQELRSILAENNGTVETKCDYCKTFYLVTESELFGDKTNLQ